MEDGSAFRLEIREDIDYSILRFAVTMFFSTSEMRVDN